MVAAVSRSAGIMMASSGIQRQLFEDTWWREADSNLTAIFDPSAVVLPAISRNIHDIWGHRRSRVPRCPQKCPQNQLAAPESTWTWLDDETLLCDGLLGIFRDFGTLLDAVGSLWKLERLGLEPRTKALKEQRSRIFGSSFIIISHHN
jgi:hypothetical protein